MSDATGRAFSTERMWSAFSAEAWVAGMLRFEAALATAEAAAGIVPEDAAGAIAAACDVARFDAEAVVLEGRRAGNPAIALVRLLTEAVPEEARGFVHWGATSQDAIDTALVLAMAEGLDALADDLEAVGWACTGLAEEHAATPMAGRTLLQQAAPVSFGLKAAGWLSEVSRRLQRVRQLRGSLPVQLGGATGTLAALGDSGPRVLERIAGELGLAVPDLPWHAGRGVVAEIAAELGVVAGTMAKVAGDVVLLMQTEVGEAIEGGGGGGSSAMPQKRNPVHATWALAAARIAVGAVPVVLGAMAQEHERGAGGWHAEWSALPELFRATAGAVGGVRQALEGLEVDAERMSVNLAAGGGAIMAEALMMALAPRLGRHEAHGLVGELHDRALETGAGLAEVARGDPRVTDVLGAEEIDRALDPSASLGSSAAFVARAVARFREMAGAGSTEEGGP